MYGYLKKNNHQTSTSDWWDARQTNQSAIQSVLTSLNNPRLNKRWKCLALELNLQNIIGFMLDYQYLFTFIPFTLYPRKKSRDILDISPRHPGFFMSVCHRHSPPRLF
jgi:hypothetical protein